MRELGAVCDVSVLVSRESFKRIQQLLDESHFYIPSATYSWLTRDKVIEVRGKPLSYSLISQFVRDGKLLVIYLPELLDELSRRLLFEVDREIPLTDIRTFMLATHMKLPLLSSDGEIATRLLKHIRSKTLWQFETHASWLTIREVLEAYHQLAYEVGGSLYQNLSNGHNLENLIDEILERREESLLAATNALQKMSQGHAKSGTLKFDYIVWDLTHLLFDYLKQHVLQPEVVRGLCERALLLLASPK